MAAPGFGTSPFVLPNMFDKPGDALQQGLMMQERRNERQADIDFRNQRLKEADDWKKLQWIKDLTDVDKYQTGESVADAIGHMKMADVLQKYTLLAESTPLPELIHNVSKEVQNTHAGMQSMKDELMMGSKTLADLKSRFPSLDTKALDKYFREDSINRRIEGNEFKNPIHVNPTNMRFDDPDFLAAFVTGDKATRDEIVNPKLVEKGVQVGMGSPSSYTMMKGDIPFFRKRNFDPDKDVVGGFLKKGINPKMEMKSTVEKLGDQNVELLDQDAFDVFSENAKLEISAKAARTVPGFYNLSKQDREKVKRKIALDDIQALDQSGFSFGSATKPPSINVSTGGGSSSADANLNNIYQRIKEKGLQRVTDYKEGKYFDNSLEKTDLSGDELEVVLKATQDKNLTPDDVKIIVEDNGRIGVYNKGDGKRLVYLNQTGSNLPKQANVAGKKASVEIGNEPYKPVTAPVGGKDKPKEKINW